MKNDALRQKLVEFVLPRMRGEGIAAWITLTREGARDPLAEHFGGAFAVGRMAIAIRPGEDRVSLAGIAASYDTAPLEDSGLYDEIRSYGKEGWSEALAEVVAGVGDGAIAVNTSTDEPIADGLSHTLGTELVRAGAHADRLVSSEGLVSELLGRKTAWEVQQIRRAAIEAEKILRAALGPDRIVPEQTTESDLAAVIADEVERLGHGFAWERPFCPSVQFGTTRGHAAPGARTVSFGQLVAVDFGVAMGGFCSDLQRTLVVAPRGDVPEEIQKLWQVTLASVRAGASAMRPGVSGHAVDEAARAVVRDAGYVDYVHATGHPLGYAVHDVGPMLGPDWPGRYGRRVHERLESGMVFTLEPAAAIESADGLVRIGLEEDVVVAEDGVEYLCPPQTELWTLG